MNFETLNNIYKNSINIKIFMIGILIIILMIPAAMIENLVSERENRKKEAITEVSSKWGSSQTIGGPVLTVPYKEVYKNTKGETVYNTGYMHFLPDLLNINGDILPQTKHRGIYKVILYNTKLNINGDFPFPKFEKLNIANENIIWKDSFMSLGIPDMKGIKDNIDLKWNGKSYFMEPGLQNKDIFDSGVSVKVPLNNSDLKKGKYTFSLKLDLNGSEALSFYPFGKKTTMSLSSKWSNPSFNGAFLPDQPKISEQGFKADWKVLDLNRNYSQQWIGSLDETEKNDINNSKFGVNLFLPVDDYTKTSRSVKYAIMFVSLTFLVFFFVEILNKKKIHPIQYLLVGLGLSLFYLLLLSISEHLNFYMAYLIASISIVILITAYTRNAFGSKILNFVMGLILTILYGFLYVLLENQDYSLLIGSVGLFIILAIVMYLSRNIDWYSINLTPKQKD